MLKIVTIVGFLLQSQTQMDTLYEQSLLTFSLLTYT